MPSNEEREEVADQIKPRYRLGTQHMLDLAKDDATKIPERTLFVMKATRGEFHSDDLAVGEICLRGHPNDAAWDDADSVALIGASGENWCYVSAEDLQPLI